MNIIMDVPILRILTLKSKLGFGSHPYANIQQLLNLKHTKYLRWVYYNIDGISFTDDILKAIYIRDDQKIQKPGKNIELGLQRDNEIDDFMKKNRHTVDMRIHERTQKKIKRGRAYGLKKFWDYVSTKEYLQAKNQGH